MKRESMRSYGTLREMTPADTQNRGALLPSFPDYLCRLIEEQIIDGRLAPAQRISEEELAGDLGVSRTPVREAMRVLEGYGLVVRKRGRGTSVAQRITMDEVRGLYKVRIQLEGFLTAEAAKRITSEGIAKLRALQSQFSAVVEQPYDETVLRTLVRADSEFHWLVYEAAESSLISIVSSYWGRLQRELYHLVYGAESPAEFAEHHEMIIRALEMGDEYKARMAMAFHIKAGWRAIQATYRSEGENTKRRLPIR